MHIKMSINQIKIESFIFIYLYVLSGNAQDLTNQADTLELLHVIFRHGDRTPHTIYPNDPYKNVNYYPFGFQELTNVGKVTAYNIGVYLKEKYGYFLGEIFTPSILEANSSPISRCRASMQLVLAALFPPTEIQQWKKDLAWQPILYQYAPRKDNIMFLPHESCPNYKNLILEGERLFETSGRLDPYRDIITYLRDNSGYHNISISLLGLNLYSILKSEQEWGYDLPSWTHSIWPEPLTTLTAMGWELTYATKSLRTLAAGTIMSKIVNDTYFNINNTDAVEARKIYLYSGHDINIVAILNWLDVFIPHCPPYGAFIIFEVHNINGEHVFKIFYQNYTAPSPQQISLPHCGFICPFDRFVNNYKDMFRAEELCK